LSFETSEDEILGVINKIWEVKEIDQDVKFSDFCILVRTNETASYFERGLSRANIPYHFISSKGLYSEPIILDIISYFKVLLDFYDSANFYRVLRSLPIDLTPEEIAKITLFANKKSIHLYEAIQHKELNLKDAKKLENLVKSINEHFSFSKEKNVSEIFVRMINDLGYLKILKDPNEENLKKWEIIDEFYTKVKDFENTNMDGKLTAFMENLQMELDSGEEGSLKNNIIDDSDSVKIMTVHSAKGLEFDYVFVVSMVHRKFPTDKKRAEIEMPEDLIKEVLPDGDFHLSEERRLFYVALTRAKKGLFLTWASDYGGKQLKKPSRFLIESDLIKEEHVNGNKKKSGFSNFSMNSFKKESNETNGNGHKDLIPDHFSFSQLAAFNSCPLQYKYSHILKIPMKGKPVFSFGKTIHNTLHRFVNLNCQMLQSEQKSLFRSHEQERGHLDLSFDDLLKIYEEEWIDAWFDSVKSKEEFREKGKGILKIFYNNFLKNDFSVFYIDNEPALEKTFSIKVGDDKFVGAIDRIDKVSEELVEIIDYKTGNSKKTLSTDDKFQLQIYNLVAQKLYDLKPAKLTYHYLEDGNCQSFEPKPNDIVKTEEKMLELISRIKRSKFKPSPGWQCKYCDYRDICAHRKF
jgi:DNA helicase-2/ATP-dependent DNA helicase PcrA